MQCDVCGRRSLDIADVYYVDAEDFFLKCQGYGLADRKADILSLCLACHTRIVNMPKDFDDSKERASNAAIVYQRKRKDQ